MVGKAIQALLPHHVMVGPLLQGAVALRDDVLIVREIGEGGREALAHLVEIGP